MDHVAMVMGLHPQYLSSFWKTQYLLLRMDGPLPYHKRHYIAIMVSSRALGLWGRRGCVGSQHCCSGSIWDPTEGPLSDLTSQTPLRLVPTQGTTTPSLQDPWGLALIVRGEIPLSGTRIPREILQE